MESTESYFLEMTRGSSPGKRFRLCEGENSIGRLDSCRICVESDSRTVSKKHAIIIVSPAGVSIEDCESTNGTFVNNSRISQKALEIGDEIGLGRNGPVFVLKCSEAAIDSIDLHEQSLSVTSNEGHIPDTHSDKKGDLSGEFSLSDELGNSSITDSRTENKIHTDEDNLDNRPLSYIKKQAGPVKSPLESLSNKNFTSLSSLNINELSPNSRIESDKSNSDNPSLTMEIQGRIKHDTIRTQDIKLLVRDTEKYDKIMRSPALKESERHLFEKFRKAYISMRNTMFLVFGTVITVTLIVTTFFVIGYVKRGNIIKNAVAVSKELDVYEQRIENVRLSPEKAGKNLKELYTILESKQRQLDSLKTFLDQKGQKKIFADTIEYFLDEIMRSFNESDYHIPPHMLARVKYYINDDINHKPVIRSTLKSGDMYFPEIERAFGHFNVPSALKYVAMQESGMNPLAKSQAGAVGLWQFMEETGRSYGLTINDSLDERTDWKKSTTAAAKYFHKLLTEYGKGSGVLLAIASYNAGPQRIRQALASIEDPLHDRDFWYLYRTSHVLVEETREYVPRILALMIIDKHRGLFGFL